MCAAAATNASPACVQECSPLPAPPQPPSRVPCKLAPFQLATLDSLVLQDDAGPPNLLASPQGSDADVRHFLIICWQQLLGRWALGHAAAAPFTD